MSLYDVFLLLHIVAAVVWVGGATLLQIQGSRILATGDGARLAGFAKDAEWIGTRLFIPAGLAIVGFGFALIYEGGWDYGAWIVFALAAYALSFVTGAVFLGPESGRVAAAIEQHGPGSPEAVGRIRRILLVSRIELAVLWAIVAAMAVKPTLDDDSAVLLVGGVVLALAIALVLWRHVTATRGAATAAS